MPSPVAALPLEPPALRRTCDPAGLPFATTDELEDFADVLGQSRAVEAIQFGVGIERDGYNLYAMGPEGVGRHTIVRRYLEQRAPQRPTPSDWCYVFDFAAPDKPKALELPAGSATRFREDLQRLVEDLRTGIPGAFETDEYRTRLQEIEGEFEQQHDRLIESVGEKARGQGIALVRTPGGFGFAPMHKDKVMSPDEFHALSEAKQKKVQEAIAALEAELARSIQAVPKMRREAQRKVRELNRQVIGTTVTGLIEEIKAAYVALPPVIAFLESLHEDVLDHAEFFRQPKEGERPTLFGIPIPEPEAESPLGRYQVNVLIEHEATGGAPIVYEDNPTHDNLVGRIEHVAQMGTLVTNFMHIKAGAFHRANGGYLILDALKVLTHPFAWEALKRAMRSREIRIESLGQALSLVSTVGLKPEPIGFDLKVVLVGERLIYYLLHAYDPEFSQLFKVAADFEEDIERGPGSDLVYARVIATMARREKLRPLDRAAVARLIEHGSRAAGDSERLSVGMRDLADLLRESDYIANAAGREVAGAADVDGAIAAREARQSRIRERLAEEMRKGTVLIATDGERAGQVNGLSVVMLGDYLFGMPSRITARVRLGSGGVVDIEREAELGGPLHSKGVMILSGFLAGRYATDRPLSLSATLVFEQNYGGVEGDSASCAELCALLSALAEAPVRQSIAMTGSVNQHGDVQAIGGVNEKIEGFFDLCQARGLTGAQGVIIPAANVRHLMLKREVIGAVEAGRFAVWPVETVDQALAILTGIPAGERDATGRFPADTVNARVEHRLAAFAERVRTFMAGPPGRREWRRGKAK
ncbi:MAG: AAA family ATPase [Betaproteobacteria bacterium]|nr:AAA family ATPase [Betaproteobacteria bacterium]